MDNIQILSELTDTIALILSEKNIDNKICSQKFPQYAVNIGYNVKYTDGSLNTKLPCLQTDNHPYWKNHICE